MAGQNAVRRVQGLDPEVWPRATAHGSLANYISGANPDNYQPANITFDLLPALPAADQARFRRDKMGRGSTNARSPSKPSTVSSTPEPSRAHKGLRKNRIQSVSMNRRVCKTVTEMRVEGLPATPNLLPYFLLPQTHPWRRVHLDPRPRCATV